MSGSLLAQSFNFNSGSILAFCRARSISEEFEIIDVRAIDAALRGCPDVDTVDAGVTGVAGFPKKEARCIETGSGRFVVVDKWWWSRSVGGRVRRSVSGGARTNDRQK